MHLAYLLCTKWYFFTDVRNNVLMRNTVPSNNDYNNDGSDYNFGTFDDFGVKDYHKEYT